MSAISSVYNYYLSTYASSGTSRYDSHKRSELRTVWNNIVKVNKESPLYKLKGGNRNDIQKFVIDLKEGARNIKNVVASLSTDDEGLEEAFEKKVAYSSNEDVITARYIGPDARYASGDNFNVTVKQLASPQINMGNYLPSQDCDFPAGNYGFDLHTPTNAYEFQFSINNGDTNKAVMQKLASLIQKANIGLEAQVVEDGNLSSLKIASTQTGVAPGEKGIFQILPRPDGSSTGLLDTLGITTTVQDAQNSSFLLNGVEQSSFSNRFTINHEFELTLNGVSQLGEETTVGFKTNVDAVTDNIQTLVDSYNSIIETAEQYDGSEQKSQYLRRDIASSARAYEDQLGSIGLSLSDDSLIHIDKAVLSNAISTPDSKEEIFSILNDFKDSLGETASNVSLNPMKYVNKVVVAYKNPGHNFATPYISSIYSGMMLDHYC